MLRYDGSSWTAVQMNGDTEGDIGLSDGQQGLMRAFCAAPAKIKNLPHFTKIPGPW
jgi:hypothetical protein